MLGAPEERHRRLAALLAQAGLEADVAWVDPGEIGATLERLRRAGARTIIVGGGDGTVNTAANVLIGSSTTLGVLPLGTFNHFARDLGMPIRLEKAVPALAAGMPEEIDVCEIDGRVFVNNASIGVYPYVVRQRERVRQQLGLSKLPAMGYALLGAFWRLPHLRLGVILDGEHRIVRAPFVFVGNNRYAVEPLAVVRRRSLSEGVLSVFYPRHIGRMALLRMVFKALLGRMQDMPELKQRWVREVTLGTRRRRVKVAMDGEVVTLYTPLRFRIRPRSLRVLRPGR